MNYVIIPPYCGYFRVVAKCSTCRCGLDKSLGAEQNVQSSGLPLNIHAPLLFVW